MCVCVCVCVKGGIDGEEMIEDVKVLAVADPTKQVYIVHTWLCTCRYTF